MNRRKFVLATAGTATAVGLAAGFLRSHRPQPRVPAAKAEAPLPPDPAFPNPLRLPGAQGMYGVIDGSGALTLVAKGVEHPILPGKPARMLAFEAEHQGTRFHNPVLRVRAGSPMRVSFWNALEEMSIIHWHGLKVDSNNDGHPHYAVPGGATYDYHFTVENRAATYWYHPHPHHLTGKQVYHGLAGFFIVEDDEELALQKSLDLKLAETDIPLVIQDRRFDEAGELVFAPTAEERFHGHYGGEVLVNLTQRPHLHVATRIYRFRILNGSNARLYRLAFRQGGRLLDYTVIGTDGGLLDRPLAVGNSFLAPGERVDVLLDLRAAGRGDAVTLVSLPFDAMRQETAARGAPAHGELTHPAGHGAAVAPQAPASDGAELELLRIRVRSKTPYDRTTPQVLSRLEAVPDSTFSPRLVVLDQANGKWRINGTTYKGDETPIVVKRGTTEIWDLRNVPPTMPHPMHIHGFQFRVLSREGSPEQQRRLALDKSGLAATDLGWKDTVLVWPGETVRIVTDFSHPFLGDQVYLVHCHNLEHEDGGMMLNLKVAA
ncbi:MAG: multicopper oxidase domain-containing protein [Betaproteobacteria bacterium]|nr:multicopper oxidase domain-containing protein [Betaproteobacteria bacterium]